ncbi:glycosyltransferase family 4 protein [Methylobacter sp. S3L5C]|uniref:glycosyltransferase family 4 protein n=1 Tax=Methylobacter sp. S3L5C TaxID=2839024 RepID=UPI001FAE19C9|nr:glycosyltransferase family 4 protein [Methylobacter sp. S3L5C]UOA09126.1 glycosyltransferase family 4 protein [Methylobacter sp. S3L5C]
MTEAPKIRVLLSAYQCGAGMGSVSQIGWEWYQRLSKSCQVTLLTHVRNRTTLEVAGTPLDDSNVIFIDTEWFAGPLYHFASRCFPRSEHPKFLIASLDFFVYDWIATRHCKRLLKTGHAWDIVHAVTPVSPMAATRLHKLGIPLILGPWNGGMASPKTFPEILKAESAWLYPVRNFGRVIDLFVGSTRNATMILTATRSTLSGIPACYRAKCRVLLENGVDLQLFKAESWPPVPSYNFPLRIVFVGRLLPVKGVTMLLEALKTLDFPVQLTIVGEGPEKSVLKTMVNQLDLAKKVLFTGNLPLETIAQFMQQAHVFCLPSVRESGGAVLLEAMAVARPVIAIDFGGPAEIVDDGIGIKLPATGKADVVQGLIKALKNVREQPDLWIARGLEGRRRVENNYSWDAKIATAIGFYRELLEPKS